MKPLSRRGLSTQVSWAFLAVAALASTLLVMLNHRVVEQWFNEAEALEAQRDAERIGLLETERRAALARSVHDYGHWMEMVEFARSGEESWLDGNFSEGTLENLDVDAVVIFGTQGETIAGFMRPDAPLGIPGADFGRQADGLPKLPPAQIAEIRELSPVRRMGEIHGSTAGLVAYRDRWWQIGLSTIQPPTTELRPAEKPEPLLVFLRAMDERRMAGRHQQAQIGYHFEPPTEPMAAKPTIRVVEGGHDVSVPLVDPILGAQATAVAFRPHVLTEEVGRIRWLLIVDSLLVILVGLTATLWLVDRRVLKRLGRLGKDIAEVRSGQRDGVGFTPDGDEIERLAEAFDDVLGTLKQHSLDWRHAALHDALTGLWNRPGLLRQLEEITASAPSRRAPYSLYLIDLDGFKNVNDLYGHAIGDRLLVAVAEGLRSRLPESWSIARLGGDEFAILAIGTEPTDIDDQHLLALIAESTAASPSRSRISASIGRVDHHPGKAALKPGELLSRADIAMYRAKRERGSMVVRYDDSMFHDLEERIGLEAALADAIAQQRITAWFQPIVDTITGQTKRLEALARWTDPVRGPIPPTRFIAVAEDTRQTLALDLGVLRVALFELAVLRRQYPWLKLSFNASVYSLLDPRYVDEVVALARRAGVPCEALLLEITETALTENDKALNPTLKRLREQGIGIALDDFGIGYSSLARLAQLKPDALKLDGSFVRNLDDGGDRIARAVVNMAEEFEIPVTAEFVETDGQRHFLRGIRCAFLQGYLIAAPMPAPKLTEWLANYRGFTADPPA